VNFSQFEHLFDWPFGRGSSSAIRDLEKPGRLFKVWRRRGKEMFLKNPLTPRS